MSNETRTTEDMIHGIVDALKSDPAELDRFLFLTIEDALGLIVKAEWDMEDNLYTAEHLADRVKSHFEPSAEDAETIAREYEFSYDEIEDEYKRDPLEPLDVWMIIPEEDNEDDVASHEANTYRDTDGEYRVAWYHTAVGLVTNEYFGTYEEAVSWYEENGYQDFTA